MNTKIGIFDSGLGGLSIYQTIRQQLPDASLCYVADSAYAPYGPRGADYVRERSFRIADFLLNTQQADALVIACNTATAAAAQALRQHYQQPIIAIEPGLKPAITASQNKTVAVLATQGTLASSQFANLCERFATGVTVIDIACRGWVELVEQGQHQTLRAYELVRQTLQPARAANADTLVLGCTHFPFLRDAILAAFDTPVTLIETADAVARQTVKRLTQYPVATHALPPHDSFWTSGEVDAATRTMSQLLQRSVQVKKWAG